MPKGKKTKTQKILKIKNGTEWSFEDEVVEERPLSILLNGQKLVTLLSTPSDQKYLALGFLFSEGLIKKRDEIKKVQFLSGKNEVKVFTEKSIKLSDEFLKDALFLSGCGKGKSFEKLEDVNLLEDVLINLEFTVKAEDITNLIKDFEKKSSLFRATGGVHSAALARKDKILLFKEDIGRHNAVDKVLGESLVKKIPLGDKILVSSGRVSSDIVKKTQRAKINLIVSRSAPTSLAIELAKKLGITIVGFARSKRMNIYTYPMRIIVPDKSD
ncbi:MAG: hypothetical protein AMJ90_05305 [candidate division Zixibacteria bacterium SM23_73_2]|nr:MAG: hypothetical protein AMJ90_05305 [candidate division Zixibacteria bacterium SM23_73_2]